MARPFRRPKLAQGLGLDLTDALASDIKLLTNLFQSVLALTADAETQPDHFLLFRREGLQNIGGLVPDVGIDHRLHRGNHPAILDQVAPRRFAVAAPWRLQRHPNARDDLQRLGPFYRNIPTA